MAGLASTAWGQDSWSTFRDWLQPRATLRSAVWSSSRTLDDRGPLIGSVVWGEVGPHFSDRVNLALAGWAGVGSIVGGSDADAALREFYGNVRLGVVDIRVGQQIIAWGRADALNPTDNLSPEDLTLLVSDDDDQKMGVRAARVSMDLRGTTLAAVWLLDFRGHTLPLGGPPSGTRLVRRMPANDVAQGALRLERTGGRIDWSASYFTGFDLTPDISLRASAGEPTLDVSHHRLQVVGADAATVLGRYGLRAEAAWLLTEDRGGGDPEIKNPTLYAVLGGDRTFGGYFNINIQYVIRRVLGYTTPNEVSDPARREAAVLLARAAQQLRRMQHGATFRVSNQWWHETLKAELAGVFLSPSWQLAIRPRLSYAATDQWLVVLGADLVRGEVGTLFHALRKNSVAFLELRLGL